MLFRSWLLWTTSEKMKEDGAHFLTLDRKAIKEKIAEYTGKMKIGDIVTLYVNYGSTHEELMKIFLDKYGLISIIDVTDNTNTIAATIVNYIP